jgi:hypothetical protein
MFKRNQVFLQEMLTVGLTLLTEVESPTQLDVWNADEARDTGLYTNEPYSLGKEVLAKLCVVMKGANVLPFIM